MNTKRWVDNKRRYKVCTSGHFQTIFTLQTKKLPIFSFHFYIKDAYPNCLKFTGCLDFQLHFQNCVSENAFMKSADEKIIFINIYDLCKNYMMN